MKTSSKVAMTLMTINEIGKRIGDLKTERERLIGKDKKLRVFRASEFEDLEKLRPDYDYAGFQSELDRVEEEIRKLTAKAISILTTQKVNEFHDITVLDLLLYLNDLKEKERHASSLLLEYEYINYDIGKVETFFGLMKREMYYGRKFATRKYLIEFPKPKILCLRHN